MRPPLSKELWYSDNAESMKNLKYKNWSGKEKRSVNCTAIRIMKLKWQSLQLYYIFICSLFYQSDDYYCKPDELISSKEGVALLTRTKVFTTWHLRTYDSIKYIPCFIQVIAVDSKNHKIKLHNGKEISYDKLLLATGT